MYNIFKSNIYFSRFIVTTVRHVVFCKLMLFVYQLGEHGRYLTVVMKDMNVEYRNAGNKGLVYSPYIGKL